MCLSIKIIFDILSTNKLIGLLFQCLPVVPLANKAQIVSRTLKSSYKLWPFIQQYELTQNMRVLQAGEDDKLYANFLLELREGKTKICHEVGEDMIEIPSIMKSKKATVEEFCDEIYPNLNLEIGRIMNHIKNRDIQQAASFNPYQWLTERAIICPKNCNVDTINEILLKKMEGKQYELKSADRILNPTDAFKEWII